MSPARGRFARGATLVELLIGMLIGGLVLASLSSVVFTGLKAQAAGTAGNEQVYQAGFALERLVLKTRAAPLKPLIPAAAGTTGDWLWPVAFCFQATSLQLRETTPDDAACAGGSVLAENVSAFSAELAPSARAVDSPVVLYSLTVAPPTVNQPITVAASVRLGGGVQ